MPFAVTRPQWVTQCVKSFIFSIKIWYFQFMQLYCLMANCEQILLSKHVGACCVVQFVTLVRDKYNRYKDTHDADFSFQLYTITATSHENHSISDHQQFHSLFNSLFRLTIKTSELCITGPLWGESIHRWWMDSPHKGPVKWKAFPCHGIVMFMFGEHHWPWWLCFMSTSDSSYHVSPFYTVYWPVSVCMLAFFNENVIL